MQIGDFIIFGLKPEKKKLGLREAEGVYDAATEIIKEDDSKSVPFAIMATAQVLGADVTVCDECAEEKKFLNIMREKVTNEFNNQQKETDRRVNTLYAQIEAAIAEINKLQTETEAQTTAIANRRKKVSEIENFFSVDLPPAEG